MNLAVLATLRHSRIRLISFKIATGTVSLTFGVNVQLCPETQWPSSNVGGDSQEECLLGRFERFLGFFAEQAVHPNSLW